MFTGIVEEVGVVREASPGRLVIKAQKVLEDISRGDSLAVNGACLTVTSAGADSFSVDVMPETFRCTNLGRLRYGDTVNLERAIMAGARFGGHIVQGHIDGTGKILSLIPEGEAVIARISVPAESAPYIVSKGFVAVDGVSLTIVSYDAISFSVSLVTYTRQHTTFGSKKPADVINIEVDIIVKYLQRLRQQDSSGVTFDFLEQHGFLKTGG